MKKIKIGNLEKIKEKVKQKRALKEEGTRARLTVHMGTCGIAAGARDIFTILMNEIEKNKVTDVIVATSGCAGLCSREPMATVELVNKPPVKYVDLTPEKIKKIFSEHVMKGNIVQEYALCVGSETTH